ncbi:hypothetical protein BN7_6749 [Wickerhamomyces ciferrii]|uniref:Kinetochore protein n=1 Tax=Wickerhamomyces ciferrii (strain ATCC 14091 / BCRC 22168 / CBS 111 / JCM 3599 / NBRC 0793 / NRRL Y-1031 F-60-10) TaxID=1206466 RepID=K0L106_WICCF|nr:uncharacterized protein BN7_6749 [Wickerhamomyces ciferrii]CCH47138.1 hypothetical protein BN7_6749 [Wickerhamomyces ciferrii]
MDQNKIIKISKKYTNRTVKSWQHPSKQVISNIRKILELNKIKSLQLISKNNNTLMEKDFELDDFIKVFISQLVKSKLPKTLQSELDYDLDYQLKKEKYLVNLISNEINQLNLLQKNLKLEKQKNKDIKRYLHNYETLLNKELEKLNDDEHNDKHNEQNKSINLSNSNDPEINNTISELKNSLNKIDQSLSKYNELSHNLNDLLS